jgi:hypothetical protein
MVLWYHLRSFNVTGFDMTTKQGYGDPSTWSGRNPYDENTDGFQTYISAAQEKLTSADLWEFLHNHDDYHFQPLDDSIDEMIKDNKVDPFVIYSRLCVVIDKMTSQRARQLEDAHILQQANDFEVKDDY